jgi:5-methyltetrahydropteroyltriglutamate--homocysteine methyltransferase
MADNARPPFRADHVGSLLRPKEVHQARDEFAKGQLTAEELKQVEPNLAKLLK